MTLLCYACVKNRLGIIQYIISNNSQHINLGFRYASNVSIALIDYFISLGANNYIEALVYLISRDNVTNFDYLLNTALGKNIDIDYYKLYY